MNPVVRNAEALLRMKAVEEEYWQVMRPDPIKELAEMLDNAEEYDASASRTTSE